MVRGNAESVIKRFPAGTAESSDMVAPRRGRHFSARLAHKNNLLIIARAGLIILRMKEAYGRQMGNMRLTGCPIDMERYGWQIK